MTTPTPNDRTFLIRAVQLARKCTPSDGAFSVGALIVDQHGQVIADGFSRELGPSTHAEEVALRKAIQAGASLQGATVYSSLEPCGRRLSGRKPCAEHLIEAGIARVVYAMDEPPVFVEATGIDKLRAAGVVVVAMTDLASLVQDVNSHLIFTHPPSP